MSQGSREPATLADRRPQFDDFEPGRNLPPPAEGSSWFDDDPPPSADPELSPYGARPARNMAEDLPRPMEVTGRAQRVVLDGQVAHTPPGRSTRVPLMAAAVNNPAVAQLHVYVRENGVMVSLGKVDALISEEEFVQRYEARMPQPGQPAVSFELRTLNDLGQPMGQAWPLHIGADHVALQDLRAAKARPAAGGALPAYGYPAPNAVDPLGARTFDLLTTVLSTREADARRQADEQRRRDEAALSAQLALTQQSNMGVTDAYNKMIEADQARQTALMERTLGQMQHGHEQTTGFLNTVLAQQAAQAEAQRRSAEEERRRLDQQHQADMERLRYQAEQDRIAAKQRADEERAAREDARMERERLAAEAARLQELRLQAERERLVQEREDAREEQRRKDAEREREYQRKEAQLQRDHERSLALEKIAAEERQRAEDRKAELEREHQKRLRELELEKIKHLDGQANTLGFGAALGPLAGLLKTIGLDPKEVAQRALGIGGEAEEAPSQTVETIKALAPVAGGVIQAALQAWASTRGAPLAPVGGNRGTRRGNRGQPARLAPGRRGPVAPPQRQVAPPDDGDEYDDEYEDEGDEDDDDYESEADVPAPTTQRPAFQPAPGAQQRAIAEGLPPQTGAVIPLGGQGAPVAVAAPVAASAAQAQAAAPAVSQVVDPAAALSPQQMAVARRAAGELIEVLQDSAPEAWEGHVISSLTAQPLIYELIQRQGLRLVVLNAGGDVGLFTRLRDMLRANPLVPGDLNYGD